MSLTEETLNLTQSEQERSEMKKAYEQGIPEALIAAVVKKFQFESYRFQGMVDSHQKGEPFQFLVSSYPEKWKTCFTEAGYQWTFEQNKMVPVRNIVASTSLQPSDVIMVEPPK